MEKQTYSVEEAAKVLNIGRQLAYELVRQGKLPAIRLGVKRVVVPKAALHKLLAEAGQEEVGTPA